MREAGQEHLKQPSTRCGSTVNLAIPSRHTETSVPERPVRMPMRASQGASSPRTAAVSQQRVYKKAGSVHEPMYRHERGAPGPTT